MKLRAAVLLCAALVVVGARAPAADSLPLGRFGDYLDALRVQSGVPGLTAAIVGTSGVLWQRAFGQQNLEASVTTRTDTPFQLDAITQVFTAVMAMQCVESGRLSLDDRIGQYAPNSPDANATVRQVLTHTSGTDTLTFAYRPDRLGVMWDIIRTCTGDSYRGTLINLLDRLAMVDSIPGLDVLTGKLTEGVPSASDLARYSANWPRVATPYAVDASKRGTPLHYSATALTPYSALITSVQDYAQFDLALKAGVLLRSDTIGQMWQAPAGRNGQRLPHGIGWFVQNYAGEPIVWQYGVSDSGTSSLLITAPNRGLTLIMLANSSGLVRPFDLSTGDITVSPFAQLFLGTFVK